MSNTLARRNVVAKFIQRPQLSDRFLNDHAVLPYGLTVAEVRQAMHQTYDFLHAINTFLVERGYGRLEDILLGNSFAGVLSETLVKNLSDASHSLTRNRKVGGHPDLILPGRYPGDAVLRGEDGVEVKASKTKGGWQGHNPESGWVMIFRYIVDATTEPVEDRHPTEFVEVLAAELQEADWSFSGRTGTSRRTITASINAHGTAKLRNNPVFRNPEYAVGAKRPRTSPE